MQTQGHVTGAPIMAMASGTNPSTYNVVEEMEPKPSSSSDTARTDDDSEAPGESPSGNLLAESSPKYLKKCLEDANDLKQEATEYFRAENWAQALATYSMALGRLPKRAKDPEPYEGVPDPEDIVKKSKDEKGKGKEKDPSESNPEPVPLEGVELDVAKLRAILNANIGACHVKLEEYKEAVKACSEALADDPNYIKALQRRASCNEKIDSWASLSSAQDDYNKLLELLPPNSPQYFTTKRAVAALKPRIEEAQKRETTEVLGKLKDLGNSILGNFGLSTDNFKFEKNEQGGYSMNFVQ